MANEKRLIDANALYSEIEEEYDLYYGEIVTNPRRFAEMVENAPAVDSVEVRCEKCKHYQQYHKGKTNELCEWGKCKLISMDIDMPCNGFCCFGERRSE